MVRGEQSEEHIMFIKSEKFRLPTAIEKADRERPFGFEAFQMILGGEIRIVTAFIPDLGAALGIIVVSYFSMSGLLPSEAISQRGGYHRKCKFRIVIPVHAVR